LLLDAARPRLRQVTFEQAADGPEKTGLYYDERGRPMLGSALVREPRFQDRVVAETRALLATVRP